MIKTIKKFLKCRKKGHKMVYSSCPFTGFTYGICNVCGYKNSSKTPIDKK